MVNRCIHASQYHTLPRLALMLVYANATAKCVSNLKRAPLQGPPWMYAEIRRARRLHAAHQWATVWAVKC